jgi:hypothetical protein
MRLSAISVLTMFLVGDQVGIASAQTATLPYDHVHLAVPDQLAAVEWYRKNLGGQPSTEGKDRVTFGKTRFIFLKAEAAKPSAGSAIDHIGFSFADVVTSICSRPIRWHRWLGTRSASAARQRS